MGPQALCKQKWTMSRDPKHGQSEILGGMGVHHDNFMFLGTSAIVIDCHGPWFCIRPTTFLMDQMLYPVAHETLSTWCHVGHHVDFFYPFKFIWSSCLRGLIQSELRPSLGFLTNHISYIYHMKGALKPHCKATLSWIFRMPYHVACEMLYGQTNHFIHYLANHSKSLVIDTKGLSNTIR